MTAHDYNKLNELLSQFSALTAALEAAEAEIKTVQIAAAQDLLPKHAAAKVNLANLDAAIRKQCDALYEDLFPDPKKRSHKTPFGEVQYRKSTSLEYDDEEKVTLRIARACDVEQAEADRDKRAPLFTAEQLLRTKVEPNLEALEAIADPVLHIFGIAREKKDNFKIVPFAMKSDKPSGKKQAG